VHSIPYNWLRLRESKENDMWAFEKKIGADEFVSIVHLAMDDCRWKGPADEDVRKYIEKIEEKEEVAYQCFYIINSFEYGLNMEGWQHELLNVLFVRCVADHFDKTNILAFAEAEKFLFDRINYYFEVWQKYKKDTAWLKLPMAIACMLVYQKPYEEYMSKGDEVNYSPGFWGVGLMAVSYTVGFAKGYFEKIGQKYQVVFDNNDKIRHTSYAMHYNDLNKWRKIEEDA
jgi:hypothetical protein